MRGDILCKSCKAQPLKVTKSQDIKVNSQDLVIMQNFDDSFSKIRSWIDDGKANNPRKGCNESYVMRLVLSFVNTLLHLTRDR